MQNVDVCSGPALTGTKTHTLLYYLNLNGTDRNGPCSYSGSSQNSRKDTYLKSVKTRQTPLLSYTRKKRLSPFTTQAIYTRPRQTYLWINTPGSSNSKFCRPITQEPRGGSYWRLNKSRKEERRTRRWRCASSVEKPTYPKWTTSSYGCGKWYLRLLHHNSPRYCGYQMPTHLYLDVRANKPRNL